MPPSPPPRPHPEQFKPQKEARTPPFVYITIALYLSLSLAYFLWSTFPRYDMLSRFERWMHQKVWSKFLGEAMEQTVHEGGRDAMSELGMRGEMARSRRQRRLDGEIELEIMCVGEGSGTRGDDEYIEMGSLPRERFNMGDHRFSSPSAGTGKGKEPQPAKKTQVKTQVVEMDDDEIWGFGRRQLSERGETRRIGETGWRKMR